MWREVLNISLERQLIGLFVFVWLHKLEVTMSYNGTLSLIERLGENHDAKVHEWRKSLLAHLTGTSYIQPLANKKS